MPKDFAEKKDSDSDGGCGAGKWEKVDVLAEAVDDDEDAIVAVGGER